MYFVVLVMWPDQVQFVSSEHLLTIDFPKEILIKPLLRLRISQPSPTVRVVYNRPFDPEDDPEIHLIFVLYPPEVQATVKPYLGLVHDVSGREVGPFAEKLTST